MESLRLTVLGANAAQPSHGKFTSSVHLSYGSKQLLIDCGEGIQTQFRPNGLSYAKLDAVLISHLHGDHVLGLPGLLSSLALQGRKKPLILCGPPDLEPFLLSVARYTQLHQSFELTFISPSISEPTLDVLSIGSLRVSTLPLKHRIEALGFVVSTIPAGRKIRTGVVEKFAIPYSSIPSLRKGADFNHPTLGTIPNADLTLESSPSRTVAYLTDTSPLPAYPIGFPSPDILIHDATFSETDKELAIKTGHSTVVDAAAFAKTCQAKKLLLTHLSQRYSSQTPLLETAKSEFENSAWAIQGNTYEI